MEEIWSVIQTDNRCQSPVFPQAVLLTRLDSDPYPASWQESPTLFLPFLLPLWLPLFRSLSLLSVWLCLCPACLPVLGAGLVPFICPSSAPAWAFIPQVLVGMLPHPLTRQTGSPFINIRVEKSKMKVVMWPDPVIWHQCCLECIHKLIFKVTFDFYPLFCYWLWAKFLLNHFIDFILAHGDGRPISIKQNSG